MILVEGLTAMTGEPPGALPRDGPRRVMVCTTPIVSGACAFPWPGVSDEPCCPAGPEVSDGICIFGRPEPGGSGVIRDITTKIAHAATVAVTAQPPSATSIHLRR